MALVSLHIYDFNKVIETKSTQHVWLVIVVDCQSHVTDRTNKSWKVIYENQEEKASVH